MVTGKGGFFAPFSFLYGMILSAGIAGYHILSQKQLYKALSIPFTGKNPSEQEKRERLGYLKKSRAICLFLVLLLTALAAGSVYILNLSSRYTIGVHICFFAYAACMVLFGIHNVIYNSHIISFFTVGILLIARRPAEETSAAAGHYLNLCRRQLLSLSHKTMEDCQDNPKLRDKLDASIHARMATGRIYDIGFYPSGSGYNLHLKNALPCDSCTFTVLCSIHTADGTAGNGISFSKLYIKAYNYNRVRGFSSLLTYGARDA